MDGAQDATPQACAASECAATSACEALTADDVPPTIAFDSATTSSRPEYLLEGTVTDAHQIRDATVSVDGGEPRPLTLDGSFGQRTFRDTLTLAGGITSVLITAEDVAGNRGQATLEVTYEAPADDTFEARFSPPEGAVAGQPAVFDAAATTAPPDANLQYRWDFGDGVSGRGLRTSHAYAEPGEYVVELAVADLGRGRTSRFLDVVTIEARADGEQRIVTALVDVTAARQPVADARLKAHGSLLARTDASGRAQLDLPVDAFVDIEAQADGYVSLRRRITTDANTTEIRIRFELTARAPLTSGESDDDGFAWRGGGASVSATSGGLVDAQGAPASDTAQLEITAIDPCTAPASLPDAPAYGLDTQQVIIDPRAGAHVDASPNDISDDPAEQVTLTLSVCDTTGLESGEVQYWHLEDTGLWVQRGIATVAADSTVTFPISEDGWWAVGPSYPQLRAVDVDCEAGGAARECTLDVTSSDGRFAATRFVPASGASVSLPAVELQLDATTPDGACEASSTLAATDTSINVQMDCYGDDFIEIDYQTPPFDIIIDAAEPIAGYRFEGEQAEGAWFDLSFPPNAGVSGTVRLIDAEQRVLASYPVAGDHAGVGFALPFDGTYFIELELTGGFGTAIRADLRKIPVIDYQTTFSGTWQTQDATVEHLLFVDPQRPVMNVLQYGDVSRAATDFVDFSGEAVRGLTTGFGGRSQVPASETGVTELPRGGFWLVRLRPPVNTAVRKGDYLLEAVTIDPAEELQFDNLGRAMPRGAIARLGDHRLFTFDAAAGDGVEVALSSAGANAAERLFNGAVRLSRVGSGTAESPEEVLRDYSYFGSTYAYSLDTFSATLPSAGTYVLEVYHHDYADFSSELGGFDLRVDKVASAATIVVDDDAACSGVVTRSVLAAVAAAPTDGKVELCEGDWELEIELPIRTDGLELAGRGRDLTSLRRVRTLFTVDRTQGVIDVLADRVRLADMELSARSPQPNPASEAVLVEIKGNEGTLEDLRIRTVGSNRDTGVQTIDNRYDVLTVRRTEIQNVQEAASLQARTLVFEDNALDVDFIGLMVFGAEDLVVQRNTQPAGRFCYLLNTSPSPTRVLVASNECTLNASSSIAMRLTVDGRNLSTAGDFVVRDNDIVGAATFSVGFELFARGVDTEITVDANRFDIAGSQAVVLRNGPVVSTEGHYRFVNNLFLDHGASGAIIALRPDVISGIDVLHNTFVSRAGTSAVGVDLYTRYISSGVLPVTFRNNIVRGDGDDRAVAMSTSQSGPYSLEYGNNLLQGIGGPYPGLQNTTSDTDVFGNAQLDMTTFAPAPASPAVDAVACDLGVTSAFGGVTRPQGARCDIGAHEQ